MISMTVNILTEVMSGKNASFIVTSFFLLFTLYIAPPEVQKKKTINTIFVEESALVLRPSNNIVLPVLSCVNSLIIITEYHKNDGQHL